MDSYKDELTNAVNGMKKKKKLLKKELKTNDPNLRNNRQHSEMLETISTIHDDRDGLEHFLRQKRERKINEKTSGVLFHDGEDYTF